MVWRLLAWYIVILGLGWMTFPLTFRLLDKLPDRGYAFSRILGLLLWGFGFWLLGSINVLQNNPGGVLFALILLVVFSLWSGWHKWGEISDWVLENWRFILMSEAVFILGFAFMTLVRASDPDATGTEKPMELAFINAVLNSDSLPPHDPWLSGYAISYYHFGYIMTGMLAKLTFTSGAVAFNLMLASIFGMSAVGAYGVMYNLLVSFGKELKLVMNWLSWSLFGPLFLLYLSNLAGVLEVLYQAGVGWNLGTATSRFWRWVNIESLSGSPSPPYTFIPQRFWWWWQASRVVQDIDLLGNVSSLSPIDEFPAFSFVLGDLHPHVLVMPFVMLLVGLALNVYWGGMDQETRVLGLRPPYRLELFLVSAIALGGIAFLNTWDFPVYFSLLTGAFLLRKVTQRGWDWDRLFEFLYFAIPLGILSLLLYTPFFISFQSQAGGISPNLIYPTRGFYMWLMFGPLFVAIFLFFGWLWRRRANSEWRWGFLIILLLIVSLYALSVLLGFRLAQTQAGQKMIQAQGQSSFGSFLLAALKHRLRYGVSLLTISCLLAVSLSYLLGLLKARRDPQDHTPVVVGFILLMIFVGGLMVLGPEFLYLRDNFGSRMNTVFKFYYQAWMLWSLSAGFAAVVVLKRASWFSKIMLTVFIIAGLVYPILAFPNKTNHFQPERGYTLDAAAYMDIYQPDEAAVIDWVAQAQKGVVAEAVGGQYSGYARVSTLSGQPSVLGWPGHEGQWRGGYEEVGTREGDIALLYETPDWLTALEIIRRYDIRYIYLGSLEMNTYALNPGKFEQNLGVGFEQGDVKVFVIPRILKE